MSIKESYTIISNRAKCLSCGEIIFSRSVHDYVTCSCGNFSVDGGQHYLKRMVSDTKNYKDLSICIPDSQVEMLKDRLKDAHERNCNDFGIICAILVGCRDAGILKN